MKQIDARTILRHQPPFRFVETAYLTSENRATAQVPSSPPMTAWAQSAAMSVLPVEYAAQLMGVLIRNKSGDTNAAGVLAGITEFTWDYLALPLASVEVRAAGTRGAFHDFKADFFDQQGIVRAQMTGFIHMSAGQNSAPVIAHLTHKPDTPLYDVLAFSRDGDGVSMTLRTRPDCPVYAGHFPDAPITPGVLIAEMMLDAATRNHALMTLHRISDLMFKQPLFPGDTADLRLRPTGDHSFAATLFRDGKRLARAKLELVPVTTSILEETS